MKIIRSLSEIFSWELMCNIRIYRKIKQVWIQKFWHYWIFFPVIIHCYKVLSEHISIKNIKNFKWNRECCNKINHNKNHNKIINFFDGLFSLLYSCQEMREIEAGITCVYISYHYNKCLVLFQIVRSFSHLY